MFLAKARIWRRRLGFGRWYFLVWPPPGPEPLSAREIERGKGPSQNRAIEAAEPLPIQEVERVTQAHRDFLDEAYQAGKLLISGPRIPRTGGVVIACVKTRSEVDELIQKD